MKPENEIISEVENVEMGQEQVQNQDYEKSNEPRKDWGYIIRDVLLCIFYTMLEIIGALIFIYAVYSWICRSCDRWFTTRGLIEVGENGYYYDSANNCFVKPWPNRRVLKGCVSLEFEHKDSIGIVLTPNGKYRYLNLNTLSFINQHSYDCADKFKNGVAIASANDTVYHICPSGEYLSAEQSLWIYSSIEEITYLNVVYDSEDEVYYSERDTTGLYKYKDIHGNYGLMNKDYRRLTPAIYSNISAITKGVLFCEYKDSVMGVLVDKDGNYIK